MPSKLSPSQLHSLEVAERVASCFSLLGVTFILVTFICFPAFRKPVNRLIFFASWGNLMANAATLISLSGVRAGEHSPLCQLQAFVIQMFFLADAAWNGAMANNVRLTIDKNYTAQQLKALEWRYHLICYGGPFLISLAYLFVNTPGRGKMYGDAQLWCWISPAWSFMRLALFYGIAWLCIVVSLSWYVKAGFKIYRKRRELLAFSRASAEMGNPFTTFTAFKTTEVSVTSESLNSHVRKPLNTFNPGRLSRNTSDTAKSYTQYSTTIKSTHSGFPLIGGPRTGSMSTQFHRNKMALDANTAAWGYTKVALLFFVSLLVTWVPSSINRIYDLAHPGHVSYPLNYASAIVLPLMGFWNSVIYITTTRALCKALFFDALDKLTFRRTSSQIEPGRVSMSEFRPPSGGELRRLQQIP